MTEPDPEDPTVPGQSSGDDNKTGDGESNKGTDGTDDKGWSDKDESGENLNDPAAPTAGKDFKGRIDPYEPEFYDYTVWYKVGDGEWTALTGVNGETFTIPGDEITGNLQITVTRKLAVKAEVHVDYVPGHTLVLMKDKNGSDISCSDSRVLTFGGSKMFYVERYGTYAYIMETPAGKYEDEAAVKTAAEAAVNITDEAGTKLEWKNSAASDYDLDGNNQISFMDASRAYDCSVGTYDVSRNMALYLRADVTGEDFKVTTADFEAIRDYWKDN